MLDLIVATLSSLSFSLAGFSWLPCSARDCTRLGGGADLVNLDGDVVIFENIKEDFPGCKRLWSEWRV